MEHAYGEMWTSVLKPRKFEYAITSLNRNILGDLTTVFLMDLLRFYVYVLIYLLIWARLTVH